MSDIPSRDAVPVLPHAYSRRDWSEYDKNGDKITYNHIPGHQQTIMDNKVVDRPVKHQEVRGLPTAGITDWETVKEHGAQKVTRANDPSAHVDLDGKSRHTLADQANGGQFAVLATESE